MSGGFTREAFDALCLSTLSPLRMHRTPREILEITSNPDGSLEQITAALERNQMYVHFFERLTQLRQAKVKWQEQSEKQEDAHAHQTPTHKMVSTFGKLGTRNLVLALGLMKGAGSGLPRSTEDALDVKPGDQMKFAMNIAELCDDQRMAHSETSFIGGLVFDWLLMVVKKSAAQPKAAVESLSQSYKEGLAVAKVAYHLSKGIADFPLSKFVFSSGLMVGAGRFLMSLLYSKDWAEFFKKNEELLKTAPELYRPLQVEAFGTSSNEMSSLIALFFPKLGEIDLPLFYMYDPYMLAEKPEQGYFLASLLFLAERCVEAKEPAKAAKMYETLNPVYKGLVDKLKITGKQIEYAVGKAGK